MSDKHTLVFIHGMGDSHPLRDFEALFAGLRDAYANGDSQRAREFDDRYAPCFVDWHEITDGAKRIVFRDAFDPMQPQETLPSALLHPLAAARTFFTFFLGDVVAYVAEHDNNIRVAVWNALKPYVSAGRPYSIIAHSLGSVIAFDFLFHLFVENTLFDPVVDAGVDLERVRSGFRGLFTLGSPIGLFMLRRSELWRSGVPERRGGGPFSTIVNPVPADRAFCNFWDKQDLVAYPLERLFAQNPANASRSLEDLEVATGPEPISAHLRYWHSREVAEQLLARLA